MNSNYCWSKLPRQQMNLRFKGAGCHMHRKLHFFLSFHCWCWRSTPSAVCVSLLVSHSPFSLFLILFHTLSAFMTQRFHTWAKKWFFTSLVLVAFFPHIGLEGYTSNMQGICLSAVKGKLLLVWPMPNHTQDQQKYQGWPSPRWRPHSW